MISALTKRLKTREISLLLFMIVAGVAVTLINPVFIQLNNLISILYAASFIGIICLAEMVVMLDGGVDISVGAIVACCAVAMSALIQKQGWSPWLAGLVCLGVGLALGAFNGVLVAQLHLPPIIATLATLRIYRGFTELGLGAGNIQPPLNAMPFLTATIGPIPISIIIFFVLAAILALVLNQTRLGRQIYAVGGNEQGAAMLGINVKRVHLSVYALCGLLCAIASFVLLTRVSYVDRRVALGTEFLAIAAIVMGGVSMYGGKGKVLGAVLGVILLFAVYNALILINVSGMWQNAVTGAVIILAVVMDSFRGEKSYE
jgi:ribose/xylose/arabinose/galactoside ABC-type transport system permease subunit